MDFLTIFLIVFVLLVAYIVHTSCILYKVNPQLKSWDEVLIAYTTYVGDYSQAYKVTQDIEKTFQKYGVDLTKQPCVGIYYDNPNEVERSKCRAVEGKILPKDFDYNLNIDGIKFGKIPFIEKAIQVEFPLKSLLSIFVGIYKAYPAIKKFADTNNLTPSMASFEVYGWEGQKILFVHGTGEAQGLLLEFPQNE